MSKANEIFIKCANSSEKKNLFVFPHAGASPASYISAIKKLQLDLNVFVLNLPGRLFQTKEKALVQFDSVKQVIIHFLQHYEDQQNYFFGHSMGSLFVYELIKHYHDRRLSSQWKFGICALRPPDHRFKSFKISELSEESFAAHVEKNHFIPEEVKNNPNYYLDFISTLKNDFKIIDSYSGSLNYIDTESIISIFGFEEDNVAPPEELLLWTQIFKKTQGPDIFPGDHFQIFSHLEKILSLLFSSEETKI